MLLLQVKKDGQFLMHFACPFIFSSFFLSSILITPCLVPAPQLEAIDAEQHQGDGRRPPAAKPTGPAEDPVPGPYYGV